MNDKVKKVIENLYKKFNPISIFLYGSRARGDFLETSDYEIGVLYSKDKKIFRTELNKFNPIPNIRFYPFEYEGFLNYRMDTPFPKNIYYNEIILSGKTLKGKEVLEKLKTPSIKIIDLLQSIEFNTGLALGSILSYRCKDFVTSREEFSKSCLFGARCLVILEKKEFPLTYDKIYKSSINLEIDDYSKTIKHAIDVRNGKEIEKIHIYKNISFLNQVVKEKILSVFKKEGNLTIIN